MKEPADLPAAKAVGAISTMYDLTLTNSFVLAQPDMETREITIEGMLREQIKEKQVLGPSAPVSGNISLGEVCGQWIADRESAMNGNRITEGTYE